MDGDWDVSSPTTRVLQDPSVFAMKRKREASSPTIPADDEGAEEYAPKYPPFPKTAAFQCSPPLRSPPYTPERSPVCAPLPTLHMKSGKTVSLAFISELDVAQLQTLLGTVTDVFRKKSTEMHMELQVLRREAAVTNAARSKATWDFVHMDDGPKKRKLALERQTLLNTALNTTGRI